MNIKQKKAKAKAEEKIEQSISQINEVCGCSPTLEIDWESFETEDDFRIASINMGYVAEGLARVCKEYQQEVADGLKTVKIAKASENTKSLVDGVMAMTLTGSDRVWTAPHIQKLVEENL